MSGAQDLVAVAVALAALYGLGLPVALLLPAPDAARWVHRIAIAPMLGIAIAYPAALLLKQVPIRLHPAQLLVASGCLWLAALLLRHRWWVRPDAKGLAAPVALVVLGAVMWGITLWGYGLYLPNRDFKNHATFVAEVAYSGSAAFTGYPLGLHTLLGWALPTPEWSSVGVTASAAFLAMSITLPLAMLTLGRMWDASRPAMGVLAAASAVLLPGAAGAFDIGSVPILVGTACYAAACGALWMWFRRPALGTSLGLILCWAGLLFLHVAEAVALGFVLLVGLPMLAWRNRHELTARRMAPIAAASAVMAVIGMVYLQPNLAILGDPTSWDVEPNVFGPAQALLVTLTKAVTTQDLSGLMWLPALVVGMWMAYVRRLSPFPAGMLAVPLLLAVVAGGEWAPDWLRAASAAWYGAIGRIAYLAAPSVLLFGSLALATLLDRARTARVGPMGAVAAAALGLVVAVPAQGTIDQRRDQLAGSLAGAGDTPEIANDLAGQLEPGQTVLAFEGDGGALLFAHARVPLVGAGVRAADLSDAGEDEAVAIAGLADVRSPAVARALAALGVRWVVLGTTSLYWGQQWGITLDQLTSQSEFSVVRQGTDITVLRYEVAPR